MRLKNILILLILITGSSLNIQGQITKKPNVILIMADDLGWGDTGYNGNKIIKTPHLDQMAKDGIQFNRFYSASAVCSPTRASFLTGRNPYRTGVFTANKGILRPEETTITELLQKEGYVTGHFGKWHLGTFTHTEKDANRGRPGNVKEYNPASLHGYNTVFATESKVPTYNPMVNDKGQNYGTSYWNEKNEKITKNLSGDDSRVIMDRVIPFIEDANKKNKPFCAIVWFHAPHKPCVAGPKHLEMYKDQPLKMQHYAGCITAMDDQIGRLRSELKSMEAEENTIITFCSDNGPERGTPGTASNFRDRKRSLHEGGIRVPGLLVWPKQIEKGFISNQMAYTSDYLPTIAEILKINLDKKIELDGESILPIIKGERLNRKHNLGFAHSSQLSLQGENYKLYAFNKAYELYDIKKDSLEQNNLASEKKEIVESMKTEYNSWLNSVQESFEGKEYGKYSFDRMQQTWTSPLKENKKSKPTNSKKNKKKK
jgi:arylsulfatase A-like enzyme